MRKSKAQIIAAILALILFLSAGLPWQTAEAAPAYTPGTYRLTGNMYVRSGPDKSYSSLGVVTKGTTIEVFEVKNTKWGRIDYRLAFTDLFDEDHRCTSHGRTAAHCDTKAYRNSETDSNAHAYGDTCAAAHSGSGSDCGSFHVAADPVPAVGYDGRAEPALQVYSGAL